MSDRSGIGSQKMKRRSRALIFFLLAGCFFSMPCRASTNEDLSVPPIPDLTAPTPISSQSPPKTDASAKSPQAPPVTAKPESASQKPSAPKVLAAPAAKASAGASVKAPVVDAVPALPGAKAEAALQKNEPAADQAAKISAARESVKLIESRAQQRMRDVQWKREDTEIANPFPPKTRLEAIFLQADEFGEKPDEVTSVSNGIFTGKLSVSDIDLQQLRTQLDQQEGRGGLRRYEKVVETEGDAALGDASQADDINLRLPPMD